MDFWKHTEDAVVNAVNNLMEKNRRTAMVNRLKIVIRNDLNTQNRAFIQIGKYYYQNLRDKQNGDTELYCAAADKAGTRLARAYAKLDDLRTPSPDAGESDAGEPDAGPSAAGGGEESQAQEPPIPNEPDPDKEEAASDDENPLDPFRVKPGDEKSSDPDQAQK